MKKTGYIVLVDSGRGTLFMMGYEKWPAVYPSKEAAEARIAEARSLFGDVPHHAFPVEVEEEYLWVETERGSYKPPTDLDD